MSVLDLDGISKAFHQRTANAFLALDQVNLSVADGDFITIVGGNGAGKSTLLNMVSGAIFPDVGTVTIDGEDVTRLGEEERASRVARVFQDPMRGTAPRMTVAENMMLAAKRGGKRALRISMNSQRREEFAQALAPLGLGLEERLDTEIGVLSGGQRQSVALIMATLKTPRLLLLDEHTAALDPKTARAVLEFTAEVVERAKLTAIMITHNLKDALAYGNRTIVMHHGRIVRDISDDERAALTDAHLYQILSDLAESDA